MQTAEQLQDAVNRSLEVVHQQQQQLLQHQQQQQQIQQQQQLQQQQQQQQFTTTESTTSALPTPLAFPPSAHGNILHFQPTEAEIRGGLGLSPLITNGFVASDARGLGAGFVLNNGNESSTHHMMMPLFVDEAPPLFAAPNKVDNLAASIGITRSTSMDIDNSFNHLPPPPPLLPSTSEPSSTLSTPTPPLRHSFSYYPASQPGTPSSHPHHSTTQRHHPYANSTRPPNLPHSASASALPVYFTPLNGNSPAPTPSTADSGTSSPVPGYVPHRVSSAPQFDHLISSSASSSVDNMLNPNGVHGGLINSKIINRDWDGDRRMEPTATATGYFDPPPSAPISYQPSPSVTRSTATSTPTNSLSLDNESAIPAIALVRNRLPILEAALSASVTAPGEDEEQIWKGVESAFEELKRVIVGRMESRREADAQREDGKHLYAPIDREPSPAPISIANLLATQLLPPLTHSQSAPVIPLSADATVAIAQAQLQASQVQLQQAQIQQQQAQIDSRARADSTARARATSEARARAEAEEQAKIVEENNRVIAVRAEAERHQQEMYQQSIQLQQAQMVHAQQQLLQQAQIDAEHAQQQVQYQQQQLLQSQQLQQQQQQQQQQLLQDAVQQAHFSAPVPFQSPPPFVSSSSASPVSNSSTPLHLRHAPPTPSPLSIVVPSHAPLAIAVENLVSPRHTYPHSLSLSTSSLPLSPNQIHPSAHSSLAPPLNEMSMGSVMQMHLGLPLSSSMDAIDSQGLPLSIDPELLVKSPMSSEQSQQQLDPTWTYAATSPRSVSSPAGTGSVAMFPPLGSPTQPVHSSRPPRSRAASGSVSTSRSRAASGSGYQSVFDSRSRALSSASSAAPYVKSERDEEDDETDELDHDEYLRQQRELTAGGSHRPTMMMKTSTSNAATMGVESEWEEKLDPIFLEYLDETCSNLDATDAKGEAIHQTLMPKKMEKLDASTDFRPFKFRIQAFTTAFAEKLNKYGYTEEELSIRKVRQYLWAQPYISRFNDDGKKSKSKGNHIWTIEAKKQSDKSWLFRRFVRSIKGTHSTTHAVGSIFSFTARVWDPQASIGEAEFSSPSLPYWLAWDENVLSGKIPETAMGTTVEVIVTARASISGSSFELERKLEFRVSGGLHTGSLDHNGIDGRRSESCAVSSSSESTPAASPILSPTSFLDHQIPVLSLSSSSLLPSLMPVFDSSRMQLDPTLHESTPDLRHIQSLSLQHLQQQLLQQQRRQNYDQALLPESSPFDPLPDGNHSVINNTTMEDVDHRLADFALSSGLQSRSEDIFVHDPNSL